MGNITCKKPSECVQNILYTFNSLLNKKNNNNVNVNTDIELNKTIINDNTSINIGLDEYEIKQIMDDYDKPSLTESEIKTIIKQYDTTNVFINNIDMTNLKINIETITKIKPYDKIHIDENNLMSIDNSNFMFFSRYMTNNNRNRTIELIAITINNALNNNMLNNKHDVANGLNNLILTYINDKNTTDKIQLLINKINDEMV